MEALSYDGGAKLEWPHVEVSGGRTNMKGPRLTKVKAEVNGGANLKWSHAKVGGALAHLVGRYMVWR